MSTPIEDVVDAIRGQLLPEPPGPDDSKHLAAHLDADPAVVADCVRGLRALQFALDEDEERAGADDLAPPKLPDDYEVRDELGRGGMGVVYRAWQKSLQRELAVKVLRPGELVFGAAMNRFRREAQRLANLRHPHIVSVHEVGEADGHVYFTMDLVDGGTMRELLQRRRMNVTQSVRLMLQVCEAISYAHGQGVVHRDLKPANILIAEKEAGQLDAFVVDFGLARDLNTAGGYTLTGQVIGTPGYMSPEQALGQTDRIGERSDVYALGVMLYECLTRKAPFADRALVHTLQAIVDEQPQPAHEANRNVPIELSVICQKAMAKKPTQRFATVQAMIEELRRFTSGEPIRTPRPTALGNAGQFVRRHARKVLWTVPLLLVWAWLQSNHHAERNALIAQGNALFEQGNYTGAAACFDKGTSFGHELPDDPLTCIRYASSLTQVAGQRYTRRFDINDGYDQMLHASLRAARVVQRWAAPFVDGDRVDTVIPAEPSLEQRALIEWVRAKAWTSSVVLTQPQHSDAWLWPDPQGVRHASWPLLFRQHAMNPVLHQNPELARGLVLEAFAKAEWGNDAYHDLEKRARWPVPMFSTTDRAFEQQLVDYVRTESPLGRTASLLLQRASCVPLVGLEVRRDFKNMRRWLDAHADRWERLDRMDPLERRVALVQLLADYQEAPPRGSPYLSNRLKRFFHDATGTELVPRVGGPDPMPEGDDPRVWILDAVGWQVHPDSLDPRQTLRQWRRERERIAAGHKDRGRDGHYASLLDLLVPRDVTRPLAADFDAWAAVVASL